jgi:hypothetical protein
VTFAEMKREVRRRLAEAQPGAFWSDDDIAVALNEGLVELTDETEWLEEAIHLDLLHDRPYYNLRTIIGDRFLSTRPTFDTQTNRWLLPTGLLTMDQHDRRWERVVGEPQRFLVRGLWWFGLWPRLDADLGTVRLAYTALPDPLADDEDEPGFPETFHYGLVDYALTDLWAQDGEAARALAAWAAYLKTETDLGAWVNKRMVASGVFGLFAPHGRVR